MAKAVWRRRCIKTIIRQGLPRDGTAGANASRRFGLLVQLLAAELDRELFVIYLKIYLG